MSLSSAFLRWHKNLLHAIHECAKDESCKHDKHECCWDNKLIVVFTVAVGAWFTILAIVLDLQDQGESNRASNHTCICDKDKLVKLDGLFLEAKSAAIEGANDSNDASSKNDGQLDKDEWPGPPGWDRWIQGKTYVGIYSCFCCLTQETKWKSRCLLSLRWDVVVSVMGAYNSTGEQTYDSRHLKSIGQFDQRRCEVADIAERKYDKGLHNGRYRQHSHMLEQKT